MLVAMLFIGNVKAQETQILIEDNFEAYTVGNKIAEGADAAGIDWWTTWSDSIFCFANIYAKKYSLLLS